MAKKLIRPIRSEADYDAALDEIERYFENEPKPGTPEADRFDLLERRVIVGFRANWTDHFFRHDTISGSMRSDSE